MFVRRLLWRFRTDVPLLAAKAIDNQSAYLTAAEDLVKAQSSLAGGIASDPKMALSITQRAIDDLSATINTLTTVLESTKNSQVLGVDPKTGAKVDFTPAHPLDGSLPPLPEPKHGASEWQSLTISYKHDQMDSSKSLATSATHEAWSVSLFIGSASGSSDSSSSNFKEVSTLRNLSPT